MRMYESYAFSHIVNYVRRSRQDIERERRTGEDTLAEQKALMDRVLSNFGVPFIQKMEIGSGDKISTRPVFMQILRELSEGVYDAIAVKELSRLGRGSYADMGQIYDLLQTRRIYIITPWRIYDPTNASDARQIRFELFLSREEFETTRERLMGARYNYAMQGKWMAGSVPYGYRFDESSQRLVIEEDEADVVRLIYQLAVGDITGDVMGARAIATYLSRLGIPSPGGHAKWHPQVISRMLKKGVYTGQVQFRSTENRDGKKVPRPKKEWIVVDHAHEAIIDSTTFDRTQRQVAQSHHTSSAFSNGSSELAGLLWCAKCGKRLVRQTGVQQYRKKDGTVSIYHKEFLSCPTRSCTYVRYRDVEAALIDILSRWAAPPAQSIRQRYSELSQAAASQNQHKDGSARRAVERRKKDLQERLEFIYAKFESGVYTKEEFYERKGVIQKALVSLESRQVLKGAPESQIEPDDTESETRPTFDFQNLGAFYLALKSREHKNVLLKALFSKIVIEPYNGGFHTLGVCVHHL